MLHATKADGNYRGSTGIGAAPDVIAPRQVGDVRELPQNAYGSAALTWWGMSGMMLIEGITLTGVKG